MSVVGFGLVEAGRERFRARGSCLAVDVLERLPCTGADEARGMP